MRTAQDDIWIRRQAIEEDGCLISVGGLVSDIEQLSKIPRDLLQRYCRVFPLASREKNGGLEEEEAHAEYCAAYASPLFEVQLTDRVAAAEARVKELEIAQLHLFRAFKMSHAGLAMACLWHGPTHDENCSGDDTCSCKFKQLNDALNEAHRVGAMALAAVEGKK